MSHHPLRYNPGPLAPPQRSVAPAPFRQRTGGGPAPSHYHHQQQHFLAPQPAAPSYPTPHHSTSTRSRTPLPSVTGEVVSFDGRYGTVRIATGQVFGFLGSEVPAEYVPVLMGKGCVVSGLLMHDKLCGIALVSVPAVGACDNLKLREDPPYFVMKWAFAELEENSNSGTVSGGLPEIPVVLVDNSENMQIAMTRLVGETRAIGIEIMNGLNSGKPVICFCIATCVVVVELSLLNETDCAVFSTYFIGLLERAKHGLLSSPLVTVRNNLISAEFPLDQLAIAYPQLFAQGLWFPCTSVVPPNTTLEDKIDHLFSYRMEPIETVSDLPSMAFHLGRNAFHARQLFIEDSARGASAGSQPTGPTSSIYRQFMKGTMNCPASSVGQSIPPPPPVAKRQRYEERGLNDHLPPSAPAAYELPPPSPISEDGPDEADLPVQEPEGEISVGASMADLLARVRNSRRISDDLAEDQTKKDLQSPHNGTSDPVNAEKFLHWFETTGGAN